MARPDNTPNVVHELVLQNHVAGNLEGLGTPTHTMVVSTTQRLARARPVRRLGVPVLG